MSVGLVVCSVVLGGSFVLAGLRSSSPAAEPGAASPTAVPSAPAAAAGSVTPGKVLADPSAATLTGPVPIGTTRTVDGATTAFTSYAAWLVGSPAAKAEPEGAIDSVASKALSPADEEMIRGMARDKKITLDPRAGAYRVLGQSGEGAGLSAVMVELLTPITYGTDTRWIAVGGVVSWRESGWKVDSIVPREVKQPPAAASANRSTAVSAAKDSLEMPGLGWQTFSNAVNR